MWYSYDENFKITSKSVEMENENQVYLEEDLDLLVYNVIIGSIETVMDVPTITFLTKKIKSNYELAKSVKNCNIKVDSLEDQLQTYIDTTDQKINQLQEINGIITEE